MNYVFSSHSIMAAELFNHHRYNLFLVLYSLRSIIIVGELVQLCTKLY
jgi:hypothetical protein